MLNWLSKIPFLRTVISYLAVNYFAHATRPRPRPLTMWGDYTSWQSLTDRSFTGRHLPPSDDAFRENQPDPDDLVDLFRREGRQIDAKDTSVLFSFFAQWFTDSFLRTDFFDKRKNTSNHEIDLCQIYGMKPHNTEMLRAHSGGRLRSQTINGEEYPEFLFEESRGVLQLRPDFVNTENPKLNLHDPKVLDIVLGDVPHDRKKHTFAVGLEHGNSTIGNTVLNTIFLREHNRICAELSKLDVSWRNDDERIFQTARNINIVLLLKIVIEDYIRHISPIDAPIKLTPGIADKAPWGRTNWIAIEFNLLYRWHSLIPDTITLDNKTLEHGAFRNNNELVTSLGSAAICEAVSTQRAGKIGLKNTPLFLCNPSEPGKIAVKRRSVDMSRTAQLRSFNDYRRQFGLDPVKSFEALTNDDTIRERLRTLYHGDIDKLEWYVGIFAETYDEKSMMGGLLQTMVAHDAFTQALTNPLLSKRIYNDETFTGTGMEIIDQTESLQDIVRRNVGDSSVNALFKIADVQPN